MSRSRFLSVALTLCLAAPGGTAPSDRPVAPPSSSVTKIVITERKSPNFEGTSFGKVGQYEYLIGYVEGELDPRLPRNTRIAAGLLAALRFHQAVGPDRVHARIRELRAEVFRRLREDPRVRFKSGEDDAAFAGMVAFTVDGVPALELQSRLAEQNVRTRVIGEYELGWMRLSASVYNTPEQIERVAGLIRGA